MNEFITVFDVRNVVPYYIYVDYAILAVFLLGLILTLIFGYYKKSTSIRHKRTFWVAIVVLIIPILYFSEVSIRFTMHHNYLCDLRDNDMDKETEGVVKVIEMQLEAGHTWGDIIEIGGKRFIVDNSSMSSSYARTIAHDGYLKHGVYARIRYHGNHILKIEIKKQDGK